MRYIVLSLMFLLNVLQHPVANNNIQQNQSTSTLDTNSFFNPPFTLEGALYDWNRDSTTCLKLRSDFMFKYLCKEINFIGKSEVDLISILGEPNAITSLNEYTSDHGKTHYQGYELKYYYEYNCVEGRPLIEYYGCWGYFVIREDNKIVQEIGIGCR